jgi:hypothetical protein
MSKANTDSQQVFEEIMLHHPPPLRIQIGKVPTSKVVFDPENPRLKYQRQLFPDKSLKELLFSHPDTNWLVKDIEQKGVLESIFVRQLSDGNWLVVEGNRRTAVMQALQANHPNNPNFSHIPARILPQQTSEEQTALLMASCHVAGKIRWEAHEKAGHIWHMIHELHIPEAELTSTLHMGAPAIKKAAESYAILQHFKRIDGGKYANEAEGKWSFFAEMLKVKEFNDRHKKGQGFDDDFCRWVGDGRIPKAEDVRLLEEILRHTKSRNLFTDEPVTEAFEKALAEVDRIKAPRNSRFYKDLVNVINSCKSSPYSDQEAAKSSEAARDTVLEAYGVIGSWLENTGIRVPGTPPRSSR